PPKITFLRETAKLNPVAAVIRGMAYSAQHADSVTGTGTLDVARYGALLASRRLVGVRGAGAAFDGLHFGKQVTTTMKRVEVKPHFPLPRAGLLTPVPEVPT